MEKKTQMDDKPMFADTGQQGSERQPTRTALHTLWEMKVESVQKSAQVPASGNVNRRAIQELTIQLNYNMSVHSPVGRKGRLEPAWGWKKWERCS